MAGGRAREGWGSRRSFQEAAAAAGRLTLRHSNGGETDGILSSVPIIQPVGLGTAGSTRQVPCAAAGPTDGCVDRPISVPISLLPPPPVIQAMWTYAPRRHALYTMVVPAAVRVRATGSETTTSTRLTGSPVPYLPFRRYFMCCPVRSRTRRGDLLTGHLLTLQIVQYDHTVYCRLYI